MLVAIALAGCSSSSTAQSALESADLEAEAWASDAFLLGGIGFEQTGNGTGPFASDDATDEGAFFAKVTQNAQDSTLGDGRVPVWVYIYFSASKSALYATASGLDEHFETPIPEEFAHLPAGLEEVARQTRSRWTVDSQEAAAVVAANPAAAAVLRNATQVTYAFDFIEDVHWEIRAIAPNGTLAASVPLDRASNATIRVESDLPPVAVPPPPRILPAPIYDNRTVDLGADPFNLALGPCSTAASSCTLYPLVVESSITAEASLAWGVVANDFDLYILDESGNPVLSSASSAGGTSEGFSGALEPGTYNVAVVAWLVVQDDYELAVTFS